MLVILFLILQKDSIRYRDVRYKDQPLPPNSKQIITSSTNISSTTPSASLSSQITPSAQSLSAQSTARSQSTLSSQPSLSSQQALSTSTLPEQVDNPQIHMQSTTTTQKSETPDILEQGKKCQTALSKPESESSQPPTTSERVEKCQSSTIMQSELAQPVINLVQAEDKFLSDAPPSSTLKSQPPSTTENAEKFTPPTHTQSSTANTDSSILQSESSTQPSEISSSKVPLQTPVEPPATTQTSQTSQPTLDLTKSRPPLQPSQPHVLQSRSTLDSEDSHTALSKPSQGSTSVGEAPPTDAEVGVAKVEPALSGQDSKEAPGSMTCERGTGKGRDSSLAEEELLRLMHPSITTG